MVEGQAEFGARGIGHRHDTVACLHIANRGPAGWGGDGADDMAHIDPPVGIEAERGREPISLSAFRAIEAA